MNVGKRIKERRIELGMTADDLGEIINKSRATIYRYENGDIENMPTTILEPLAKALKTTPADLLGWGEVEVEVHEPTKEEKMYARMKAYLDLFDSLSDVGQELAIANMELIKKVHPRMDDKKTETKKEV